MIDHTESEVLLFPARSISKSRLVVALALLITALILLHLGYSLPATVSLNGSTVHHIWLDNIPRAQGDLSGTRGQFTAQMNRPSSGVIWLENTFQADVTLTLNGVEVYSGSSSSEIRLAPDLPQSFDVLLQYQMPDGIPPRARMGFMQRGLFGETYVQPAWDYSPPSALHDLARTGFWIMLGLAVLCVVASLPLTRRQVIVLILLWCLAMGVQGITLAEKLQHSNAHFSMENTWDNYVIMGRGWLIGQTGLAGQYSQVANFVYLGILHMVIEPDFTTLYGINAILGSLVPPLLALAAFVMFRHWQIGILTGVLTALFMPLVHYQQTLQPEAIAHTALALLMCGTALLYRQPGLFWAVVCGGLVGLCTVLRGSWILLILWVGVAILLNGVSWRRKIGFVLAAGITLAVANIPMIYINYSHGVYMLTPTRSDMQLFRSNGLDSLGLASYNGISEQLMFAQDSNYTDALSKDIARDPARLFELMLRRLGLIWQSEEHSDADQVDYENYSLKVSPTTQLLSLNGAVTFRTLLVFALTGGLLGLLARRREALLLLSGAGVWMLTMIPFYSLARFRIGMAVFLLPLAAFAIWESVALLRTLFQADKQTSPLSDSERAKDTPWKRPGVSRLAIIGLGLGLINAAVLWGADWLTDNMPRPQLVSENEFPSDFVPVGGLFGDQIQLLGYSHYETNYASEGYLTFELFWRALVPPSENVFVTLRLVDTVTGEIAHREDIRLGENTAPALPPTQWKTGDTLFEKYLLHLPDVKTPHSYGLFVGLFSMEQDAALPLTGASDEVLDDHVRVAGISALPELPSSDSLSPLAVWQDALKLVKAECKLSNEATIDLTWQIEQPLRSDVRLFVHVFAGETLITQSDQRLNPPADALPPNSLVETRLTVPDITQSDVSIQFGFYRFNDQQRLPVTFVAEGWTQSDAVVTLPCEN